VVTLLAMAAPRPAQPAPPPRDAYLHALEVLSRGEVEAAVALVVDLDTRAAQSRAGVAGGAFPRALRRIGRRRPEALAPVALLHQRVFLAHAESGAGTLASAASRQAEAIAQAYVHAGGSRVLGSALLTSLAGHWHARSQESVAVPLYRRALALDPEQPAALLGLAVVEEKRGSLRAAASLLESVLALAPLDREVRLRLALVRGRSGRLDQAMATIDELAERGGGDWIEALAHQERARLLASSGRFADALVAARTGAAALPCDPVLPVLTAFYAERTGEAAGGLAQGLTACAADRRVSPRRAYNQQPRRLLELVQASLEEVERERLAALAAALGGGRGGVSE
jgi:tetratricopeptide (TPR) repeat protein